VSIYEKRHLREHRRLLHLQADEISHCRAGMTAEQENALHDALDRLAGELATLKIMLRRLRATSNPSKGTASQILSLSPPRLAPQSKCLAP
jgi:hypothetical protein